MKDEPSRHDEEKDAPPAGNRLLGLFLRPRRFFRQLAAADWPRLTGLAFYVFGVANAIDQLDWRLTRDELQGRNVFAALGESWSNYWLAAVGLGVLSALLLYVVGGWWYCRRLEFCGVRKLHQPLARRVFVFASLVWAIPSLLYTAWTSTAYPTPRAASLGDDLGGLALVVFLFCSVFTSYRGATTVFQLRRWPARVWFLIVPGAFYALFFLALIVAFVSGLFVQAPDIAHPRRLQRPGFAVSYPGNWQIDTQQEDYDPDGYFTLEPPLADAVVTFHIGGDFETAADAVETYRVETERSLAKAIWGEFDRWGPHVGTGLRGSGTIDGHGSYAATIFAMVHADGRVLVVREICASDIFSKLEPGVDLIRRTFAWR